MPSPVRNKLIVLLDLYGDSVPIVCAICLHTKNFLLSFGFDAIIGMISMEVAYGVARESLHQRAKRVHCSA